MDTKTSVKPAQAQKGTFGVKIQILRVPVVMQQ